jgi:hypothetical protein
MIGVGAQDVFELALAEDEQPVEALATHAADPALGVRVRVRRLDGGADHRDFLAFEDVIAPLNLESRSWIRKRTGFSREGRSYRDTSQATGQTPNRVFWTPRAW